MPVFGPGTLQIGETGAPIDVSCLVNSMRITASKDESDSTTKLCGTVKPGKITYTYSLTGNIDVDSEDPAGIFALSQAEPGTQVPFTFTPNTDAETTASGTLVIDPLDFGADEYGDDMTSDLEFTLVGAPTYVFPTETPLAVANRFQPLVVNGGPAAGIVKETAPEPTTTTAKASKSDASAA